MSINSWGLASTCSFSLPRSDVGFGWRILQLPGEHPFLLPSEMEAHLSKSHPRFHSESAFNMKPIDTNLAAVVGMQWRM